jgi:hypothetical protein
MTIELGRQLVQSRLERCFELHEVGRELALTGLRMRFPEATEAQVWEKLREQLARRRRGKWGIE